MFKSLFVFILTVSLVCCDNETKNKKPQVGKKNHKVGMKSFLDKFKRKECGHNTRFV